MCEIKKYSKTSVGSVLLQQCSLNMNPTPFFVALFIMYSCIATPLIPDFLSIKWFLNLFSRWMQLIMARSSRDQDLLYFLLLLNQPSRLTYLQYLIRSSQIHYMRMWLRGNLSRLCLHSMMTVIPMMSLTASLVNNYYT